MMATRADDIHDLVELGLIYMEDGAWLTAAERLEKAVQMLREGQAEFLKALEAAAAVRAGRAE